MRSPPRIASALCVLGLLGVAAWIYAHPPVPGSSHPTCLFNVLTGFYCPGCGGTRAAYLAMHGNPVDALKQNLLIVVLLPLAAWCLFSLARFAIAGEWKWPQFGHKSSLVVALMVVAFGVVRNLPFAPFTSLAPTPLAANAQGISDEGRDLAGHVGNLGSGRR
ncbi:MAG: DUF2752 domain-containing protein [Fimbriimonadales bacterium]